MSFSKAVLCCLNQAKTPFMPMSYIEWQHCFPGYLLGACLAQLDRAKMFASFWILDTARLSVPKKFALRCTYTSTTFGSYPMPAPVLWNFCMFCHVLFCTWTQEDCELEMSVRNSRPSTPVPPEKNTTFQPPTNCADGIFSTIQDGTYTPMNSGM